MSRILKYIIIIFICNFLFFYFNSIPNKKKQNERILIVKDNSFLDNNNISSFTEQFKRYDNYQSNNDNKENKNKLRIFIFFYFELCFFLVPILSIILIYYDLKEDKTLSKNYYFSTNEKANKEYILLKSTFITKGFYLFSWFLMKYLYPLFNIFYIYNYNHPRYIRLMISIIKISFILFINTINIIDNPNTILIIFLTSLIIHFISEYTINYLLEFNKIRRNIFKTKLENLRKYVYTVVKKDILFNSKWHLIKNRMISYSRICGKYILKSSKRNKYERYVRNKIINENGNISQINNSFNSSLFSNNDDNNFENSGLKEKLLPKNNFNNKSDVNIFKNDFITKQKIIYSKNNENDKNNNFYITKSVEPFSFSKFGVNNMKLKTLKKLEDIRNRYITNKKSVKYDETLDIDNSVKTYDNLEIEALENYTYISTDAMINKLNKINTNSNKMFINVFTNIILLLLLILIFIGIFLTFLRIENGDIFFSIFFQTVFCNFFIYRCLCIFISFFIFYSHKNKNSCSKIIFNLFIEKYIRYLYKIRLLMIKYNKEFKFIEK